MGNLKQHNYYTIIMVFIWHLRMIYLKQFISPFSWIWPLPENDTYRVIAFLVLYGFITAYYMAIKAKGNFQDEFGSVIIFLFSLCGLCYLIMYN